MRIAMGSKKRNDKRTVAPTASTVNNQQFHYQYPSTSASEPNPSDPTSLLINISNALKKIQNSPNQNPGYQSHRNNNPCANTLIGQMASNQPSYQQYPPSGESSGYVPFSHPRNVPYLDRTQGYVPFESSGPYLPSKYPQRYSDRPQSESTWNSCGKWPGNNR